MPLQLLYKLETPVLYYRGEARSLILCIPFLLIGFMTPIQIYPPHIPSPVPFLGHAIQFGKSPIEFLLKAYKEVAIHEILRHSQAQ